MAIKKRQRDALRGIGIEVEEYFIDAWPPTWGQSLQRDGEEIAVIESHGCHHESDRYRNRYMLRARRSYEVVESIEDGEVRMRSVPAEDIAIRRTQRECLAIAARRATICSATRGGSGE